MRCFECPECGGGVIDATPSGRPSHIQGDHTPNWLRVYPAIAKRSLAPEVEPSFRQDFDEAVAVLGLSPRAAAALARASLQRLLRTHGIKAKDLATEIQMLIDSSQLSMSLAEEVDAIRNYGNFAAHPIPDAAGAITPVEDDEAEWTIDVLERLLDHFFVQPARAQARKDKLAAKLAGAGKPPMKAPKP